MQKEKLNSFVLHPELMDNESVVELKSLTEELPWFQMGWLLYLKNLKQIDSPEYKSVLKEVAVRVSNRKLLYKYLTTDFRKKQVSVEIESPFSLLGNAKNEIGDSLIDKFLSAKPGAIRRKLGEEIELKNADRNEVIEKSTLENDEIITETLANIYLQQKNYVKALNAYQKLSLKYPEKSVYFASQIEEIEKLKNNNL